MDANINLPQKTSWTKEAFMQQYVLNRSQVVNNLDGEGAAKSALKAWNVIQGNKNV